MKQSKKIEIIEQLSTNELACITGGFSSNNQVENETNVQSSESYPIIYINGKMYRLEKDGTLRPI